VNYLVHLYLSDPDPGCRIGNLIGDFVKGPIGDEWPPEIRRGLQQHRLVDVFAHDNADFRCSRLRLDRRYGLCRGIMIDIFYDHILAQDWCLFCDMPLPDFAQTAYRILEEYADHLPETFRPVARQMIRHDWLTSYRDRQVIERVLERVANRLSRPTLMAEGGVELDHHYAGLRQDCHRFLASAAHYLQMSI
jgi:acyl carrier protein phosphodiesterase